jgi:hypothetical protein
MNYKQVYILIGHGSLNNRSGLAKISFIFKYTSIFSFYMFTGMLQTLLHKFLLKIFTNFQHLP